LDRSPRTGGLQPQRNRWRLSSPPSASAICSLVRLEVVRGCGCCGTMLDMSDRIDRITRPDLYAAIWKQPVTAVALRLGVSDHAVRKACAAMRIPLPPRGYWARIAAGQTVRRP